MQLDYCHIGDAREVMREMIAEGVKVQMCVTSPPYWGLRDYGVTGQLGLEPTIEEYVANMVDVFRLVRELLAKDGVLFLNLGDSYAGSWGAQSREHAGKHAPNVSALSANQVKAAQIRTNGTGSLSRTPGLKPKDLCGIPWRVAFALQADGWYLRSDIIWHKLAPMPESVRDRPTRAHEYVFLLSKAEHYFYDQEAVRQSLRPSSLSRLMQNGYDDQEGSVCANGGAKTNGKMKAVTAHFGGRIKSQINDQTRLASGNEWKQEPERGPNLRDVWSLASEGFDGAHFAVMPSKLAERCILAGSRVGDVVFDPFLGSGTTAQVAQRLGRKWIGIELNPSYVKLQAQRTQQLGMELR
jgi:site-specific DNA-methyltransferase (cytosine-N4-specific)